MPSLAPSTTRPRPLPHRLLFPALPSDAGLPPLVGSSDLDAELYDFIALALRAFVVPWWSKISRYDKQFLPEITRILSTVVREVDARVRAAPLAPLLLCHVPAILTQHYRDYRNASNKLATSYASGGAASLPQLFHQLQPHMAISADGRLDSEYFRQLVDHILKVCLPKENYQPDAERFIVREVILKVLLNDVVPKITQPWFIQSSILVLLQLNDQASFRKPPEPLRSPSPRSSSSFSFHTILVLLFSAIQAVSGACLAFIHAYKHAVSTIKHVNNIQPKASPASSTASLLSPPPQSIKNYAHQPLILLSEVFTLEERVASTTILTTTRLLTDFSSSFLDRLLPHLLTQFLSPAFILSTTRTAKRTLFPTGYPGPTPPEPSPEEQAEIRARLVAWRPSGALAARLLPILLGPSPTQTLEDALDPLSSAPCNVHLVLFLLDCVLSALFPELAVAGGGGGDDSAGGGGDVPAGDSEIDSDA